MRTNLPGSLWEALNEDNKVSLFVRAIKLETGDYEDMILNKYNTVEGTYERIPAEIRHQPQPEALPAFLWQTALTCPSPF